MSALSVKGFFSSSSKSSQTQTGPVSSSHCREGMDVGWAYGLQRIRDIAKRLLKNKR
jgi:hypothetical protein